MVYYLLSLIWGLFILLSFMGWGTLIKNYLFPDKTIGWGQKAAWGVALTIFIGGILNLCWAINIFILYAYIGLGLCHLLVLDFTYIKKILLSRPSFIIDYWKKDHVLLIGLLLITLLSSYLYSGWIFTKLIHTDDLEAYAVYPKKMIEQGSLGPEFFSDRRTSALGGHSFLHALIESLLGEHNLRIIDPAIALIIAILLLWELAKSVRVPPKLALIPIFYLLLTPPLSTNTSSLVMGITLFLALFCAFEENFNFQGIRKVLIISLLVSALCASKSNLIIFCGVFILMTYLTRLFFQPNKKETVFEFFKIFLCSSVLLLPWMISSYQSSGTFLYPLLGRGYHRSAYGFLEYNQSISFLYLIKTCIRTLRNPFILPLMVLLLMNLRDVSYKRIQSLLTIFLSALGGVFILYILIPFPYTRYSLSFLYASLTAIMVYGLSDDVSRNNTFIRKVLRAILLLFFVFSMHSYLFKKPSEIWKISLINPPDFQKMDQIPPPQTENESYSMAQRSIPYGETVLVRCSNPYFFNFQRNKIYVVDFLILGPRPGMPVFKGGEAVADYLLSKGIRYVIFSYFKFDSIREKKLLANNRLDEWVGQQYKFTFAFEHDLNELQLTRKKLYEDTTIVVLDLKNEH